MPAGQVTGKYLDAAQKAAVVPENVVVPDRVAPEPATGGSLTTWR